MISKKIILSTHSIEIQSNNKVTMITITAATLYNHHNYYRNAIESLDNLLTNENWLSKTLNISYIILSGLHSRSYEADFCIEK